MGPRAAHCDGATLGTAGSESPPPSFICDLKLMALRQPQHPHRTTQEPVGFPAEVTCGTRVSSGFEIGRVAWRRAGNAHRPRTATKGNITMSGIDKMKNKA